MSSSRLSKVFWDAVRRPVQRLRRPSLKLYWWRYDFPTRLNFGDELTAGLIKRLFDIHCIWADVASSNFIGAGSVLEIASRASCRQQVQVWGSGFIQDGPDFAARNFEFAAVRGKLSANRVDGRPALGDPGILAALAYPEFKMTKKRFDVGVIPHYVDKDLPAIRDLRGRRDVLVIDVLDSPTKVMAQITSCRMILSSSLHGLVVSDSFGIPNFWTPLSDSLTGGSYKFEDYYSLYDEQVDPIELSYALSNRAHLLSGYRPRHLADAQEELWSSFPKHIITPGPAQR